MNPLKKIRSLLMAASYDLLMNSTEQRCLSAWRRDLLGAARGDLLEIGAGTGLNLAYYPDRTASLTLSEPDPYMRRKLKEKLAGQLRPVTLAPWVAEDIALPDSSFDTVVSTLVLCSVGCLRSSLQEIYRILRPGGQLLFMEHIVSDHPGTRRWQKRLEPAWSLCAGDCRLTRDTGSAITAAGLIIEQLREEAMVGTPAFVSRTIRGVARKPHQTSG